MRVIHHHHNNIRSLGLKSSPVRGMRIKNFRLCGNCQAKQRKLNHHESRSNLIHQRLESGHTRAFCTNRAPMYKLRAPQKNELLIRVQKTAVNPIDVWMKKGYGEHLFSGYRDFRQPTPSLPKQRILGRECIGVVEEVGSQVWNFRPGDHVLAVSNPLHPFGSHADHTIACQFSTALLPTKQDCSELPERTLVSLGYPGLTAWSCLSPLLKPEKHGKIPELNVRNALVVGTSGSVGNIVTRLVHLFAPEAIIDGVISGSERGREAVEGLPLRKVVTPDQIFRPMKTAQDPIVYELTDRYQLIVNCAPPSFDFYRYYDLLDRQGGHFVSSNPDLVRKVDRHGIIAGTAASALTLLSEKLVAGSGFNANFSWAFVEPSGAKLEKLISWAQQGGWTLPIDSTLYTLENLHAAFDAVDSGAAFGKVVIEVGD